MTELINQKFCSAKIRCKAEVRRKLYVYDGRMPSDDAEARKTKQVERQRRQQKKWCRLWLCELFEHKEPVVFVDDDDDNDIVPAAGYAWFGLSLLSAGAFSSLSLRWRACIHFVYFTLFLFLSNENAHKHNLFAASMKEHSRMMWKENINKMSTKRHKFNFIIWCVFNCLKCVAVVVVGCWQSNICIICGAHGTRLCHLSSTFIDTAKSP